MASNSTSASITVYTYFHEDVKVAPAAAALALYLVVALIVLFTTIRTRAWFMLTVSITGFLEVLGYAFRVQAIRKPASSPYIAMQAILVICPVLLSMVNYITVGRILKAVNHSQGYLRPAWVGRFFVTSDIICLFVQGAGGGLQPSQDAATRRLGRVLLLIGLGAQLVFFTVFLSITLYVNRARVYGLRNSTYYRPVFFCLYSTIALMYIRNIYRLVEFAQGYDAYIATHEAFFYVFDFTMIFSCFLLYAWFHFGLYLGPKSKAVGTVGPKDGHGHLRTTEIPVLANGNGAELMPHHSRHDAHNLRLEDV